jgi:hypothetical protein
VRFGTYSLLVYSVSNIETLCGFQETRCARYVPVRHPSSLHFNSLKSVVITCPKLLFMRFTGTFAVFTLGSPINMYDKVMGKYAILWWPWSVRRQYRAVDGKFY